MAIRVLLVSVPIPECRITVDKSTFLDCCALIGVFKTDGFSSIIAEIIVPINSTKNAIVYVAASMSVLF